MRPIGDHEGLLGFIALPCCLGSSCQGSHGFDDIRGHVRHKANMLCRADRGGKRFRDNSGKHDCGLIEEYTFDHTRDPCSFRHVP